MHSKMLVTADLLYIGSQNLQVKEIGREKSEFFESGAFISIDKIDAKKILDNFMSFLNSENKEIITLITAYLYGEKERFSENVKGARRKIFELLKLLKSENDLNPSELYKDEINVYISLLKITATSEEIIMLDRLCSFISRDFSHKGVIYDDKKENAYIENNSSDDDYDPNGKDLEDLDNASFNYVELPTLSREVLSDLDRYISEWEVYDA